MGLRRKVFDVVAPKEVKDMLKFLDGKKTLIGLLLVQVPEILSSVATILGGVGMDEQSALVLKLSGAIVALGGLLHKFVKG